MSEAPKFEDIIYDVRERAAWIIINRPKVYNAFRGRTLEELIKAFHLAANDRKLKTSQRRDSYLLTRAIMCSG